MRIKLTKIGNSWGVRLPKTVLVECGFQKEAELEVKKKTVLLSPVTSVRENWEAQLSAEFNKAPFIKKGEWQW